MPFVPVPNVAQANMRYIVNGERCENTLYFADAVGASPDLGLVAAVCDALWDRLRLIYGTFVEIREIYVVNLTTDISPVLTVAYTPAEQGANVTTGVPLPNNVSLAISFRTGLRGRSFRGRNYTLGLGEAQVEDQRVQAATVEALVDAYVGVLADANEEGLEWGVVSRVFNGNPRLTGLFTRINAVVATDTVVDSMRRRLPGRGV